MCYGRRRRIQRINQAYVTQAQQPGQYNGALGGQPSYYNNNTANSAYAPQYYANQPYPPQPAQGYYPVSCLHETLNENNH